MLEWGLAAYAAGGVGLAALHLSGRPGTEGWGPSVVLLWPLWLSLGAGAELIALLRRAELAALTWLFVRVQRRLARLGCTFSVE